MDEPDISNASVSLDETDIKQITLVALNILMNVCGDNEDEKAEERRYKIWTQMEKIERASPPYTEIELGFRFGNAVKVPGPEGFNRLSQQDQCFVCDLGRRFCNVIHEDRLECDLECPNFNQRFNQDSPIPGGYHLAPGETFVIL